MNKAVLHQLVDELPDESVGLAMRLLEVIRDEADPVARALKLADSKEPEELTPEESEAISEAEAEVERGEFLTQEELNQELGL